MMKDCEFYNKNGHCQQRKQKFYTNGNPVIDDYCDERPNCYYKQLLAEQAKNSELDATLKILKINHKLTISELNNEQAKNKKLVEALESAKGTIRFAFRVVFNSQEDWLNFWEIVKKGYDILEQALGGE